MLPYCRSIVSRSGPSEHPELLRSGRTQGGRALCGTAAAAVRAAKIHGRAWTRGCESRSGAVPGYLERMYEPARKGVRNVEIHP